MSKERDNTCGNCGWWQTLKEYEITPTAGTKDNEGICRRQSPGVIDMEYRSWPGTLITDWCGEWAMIEEAEAEAGKVVNAKAKTIKLTGDEKCNIAGCHKDARTLTSRGFKCEIHM